MRKTHYSQCIALISLLLVFCSQTARAHNDEVDLKLNEIKSIQVAASISAHTEVNFTLDEIENEFKNRLAQRNVKIDQNNYDNVVATNIEIERIKVSGGGTVYAANISFHYTETCAVPRLKITGSCALWEHYEGVHMFTDPREIRSYVTRTVSKWAKAFVDSVPAQ
jgi:hypothetical protein